MRLRLQHSSMQFSDSRSEHEHDTRRVFDFAKRRGSIAVTGTEAGASAVNHDLRDLVIEQAHAHGFWVFAHKWGDWVAVNRDLAHVTSAAYLGPFISSSPGMFSPRGITTVECEVKGARVGTVHVACLHMLTPKQIEATHKTNGPLQVALGKWATQKGAGSDIVFVGSDTNQNDRTKDPFGGQPLTSCWDELHQYESTHSPGTSTLDVIASYDRDRRVTCKRAQVLTDSELFLYADHFTIEATYEVAGLGG